MNAGGAVLLVMAGWLVTAALFSKKTAWILIVAGWLLAALLLATPRADADNDLGPLICQQLDLRR